MSFLLLHITFLTFGQTSKTDSVRILQPVTIQAYATDRPLIEVPASIGYITTDDLNRFNNSSILPAVNTIPGVRMEERSPGSYRFSIRGSLLRSPFGVRNVKAYWNGLPLTDGGGNTYLNLLDFNSIGNIEVIKGPGGSLYGAGTGGVILLNNPVINHDQIDISSTIGSFGLRRYQVSGQVHSEKVNARIQYSHQESDGYRQQTQMKRDALNADIVYQIDSKNALSATLFFTDLFYETPGGLTKAQFDESPMQARPAGGPNRGAVEQQAAIYNKTPYGGLNFDHEWDDHFSTRVGIFGSTSSFENPAIRNYEEREEGNFGARTETSYKFGKEYVNGKLTFGGEFQKFKSTINVFGNSFGVKDTAQTKDKLTSQLALLFAQADFRLPLNFFLTLGAGFNFSNYGFARSYPTTLDEERNLDPFFSPRLALLNKLTPGISLYGSVSRGFSPPSIAELYPSRGIFDKTLQSEQGTNLEAGIRTEHLKRNFTFDITVYHFRLKDALVIRDATNGEYFVNAGATSQKGIEVSISWAPLKNRSGFISDFKMWNSYTYSRYRFEEYIQGEDDYAGNKLTGVPPTVNVSGIDLSIRRKFYLNVTTNYVDHTPLNDGNTSFAGEYFLVGGRVGFKTIISEKHKLDIFAGVDNAFDKKYSLGNDLNALGGRYYNAASKANLYIGLKLSLLP